MKVQVAENVRVQIKSLHEDGWRVYGLNIQSFPFQSSSPCVGNRPSKTSAVDPEPQEVDCRDGRCVFAGAWLILSGMLLVWNLRWKGSTLNPKP